MKLELNLKSWVEQSKNIFDFFAFLFNEISSEEANYSKYINSDGRAIRLEDMKRLRHLFNSRLQDHVYQLGLSEDDRTLINELIDSSHDKKLVCYELLHAIDSIFGERAKEFTYSSFDGQTDDFILNSQITRSLGNVIFTPDSYFTVAFNEKYLLRDIMGTTIMSPLRKLILVSPHNSDYKVKFNVHKAKYDSKDYSISKSGLKIGMCSVTGNSVLETKEKDNYFDVVNISNEGAIKSRILKTLEHMSLNNIEIAIFPEMVITQEILKDVKEYLKREKRKHGFELIILGSIWENRSNYSVTLGKNGREISRQYKLNNFRLKSDPTIDGCVENLDLSSDERIITMLDIPKFGRVAIVICADFISEKYANHCFNNAANLIILPTYTRSLREMQSAAGRLENNLASIINCNVCTPIISKIKHKLSSEKSVEEELIIVNNASLNFIKLPIKSGKTLYPEDGFKGKTCYKIEEKHLCDMTTVCYQILDIKNSECLHKPIRV